VVKIPEMKGMIIRSSKGGKKVLDTYLDTARKYSFTGACVVKEKNFWGILLIKRGLIVAAMAIMDKNKIYGKQAMDKIKEEGEKKSSTIELWAKVNIDEIIENNPKSLLELPDIEKYEREGFSTEELQKKLATTDDIGAVMEEYEDLVRRAKSLIKKLNKIKDSEFKERIRELKSMLRNPYTVEKAEKIAEEIFKSYEKKAKREETTAKEEEIFHILSSYERGKRCPICGELLNENGVCDFCGYGKMGNLIKTMTFKNFILGQSNVFAYNAAIAVAHNPGSLNPLIIHSASGLGKTHLINAIGNAILEKNPDMKIIYISAENLAPSVIKDLWTADVLLIDDFQFIPSDRDLQLALYKLLERKVQEGKQVVIGIDRNPREILNIIDKLVTFLEGGITVTIERPEFETRVTIARRIAEEMGVEVDEDVLEFIAKKFKHNAREIEGAIKRVIAFAKLVNQNPTLDLAKEVLKAPVEEYDVVLSPGKCYVVEEDKPSVSLEFLENVEGKKLCISRMNPRKLMENYDLRDTKILWLTHKSSEDYETVPPALEHLMYEIENFLTENKEESGAVYIDGVEYLISENGFDSFIQFLRSLVDMISVSKFLLIISVSPDTVERRHLRMIEREMDEVLSQ